MPDLKALIEPDLAKAVARSKEGLIEIAPDGKIMSDDHFETNIPGVFVAGDARHGSTPRINMASAEGQHASVGVNDMLANLRKKGIIPTWDIPSLKKSDKALAAARRRAEERALRQAMQTPGVRP